MPARGAATIRPTLSDAALRHFQRHGWVRIPGAFAAADATHLRDLIWAELTRRYGARSDQPATWDGSWCGLKPLGRHAAFRAIATPRLGSAIDQLIGSGRWQWPRGWNMFLVSPPQRAAGAWRVPEQGWHFDALPQASTGLNSFVFYDHVAAQGGGTLLLEGSHRLLARFLVEQRAALDGLSLRAVRERFAEHHPWLRRLHGVDGRHSPRRLELLRPNRAADGEGLRVREMTGAPGDVILWCDWMYHVHPSHHLGRPRLMGNARIPLVGAVSA